MTCQHGPGNDAHRARKWNPSGHRRRVKGALALDVGESGDSSHCWRHQKMWGVVRKHWLSEEWKMRAGWKTHQRGDNPNTGVRLPTLACIQFQMLMLAWRSRWICGPFWSGSCPTVHPRQCVVCSATDLFGLSLLYGTCRSFARYRLLSPLVEFWALLKTTARDLFSPLGAWSRQMSGPGWQFSVLFTVQFSKSFTGGEWILRA